LTQLPYISYCCTHINGTTRENLVTKSQSVAGIFGAGTAFAALGISYDPGTGGTGTIGIGDQTKTGATANAAKGNQALAVSLIAPSKAIVVGGSNNNAFALDGQSVVTPDMSGSPKDNNVFTSYGASVVRGAAQGNTVINAGGVTMADGGAKSEASIQFCGTRLSAQSSHITTGKVPTGGLC
jgi:hypothetical protein